MYPFLPLTIFQYYILPLIKFQYPSVILNSIMSTDTNTLECIQWSLQFNNNLFPHIHYNALEYLQLQVPTSRDKRLICHSTDLYCFGFVLFYALLLCDLYLHVLMHVQAHPDLRNSYVPEGPMQVEFRASRNWVYIGSTIHVYTQDSSVKIQTPTYWNPIGRSITIPLCYSPARNQFETRFKYDFIFYLFKRRKSATE